MSGCRLFRALVVPLGLLGLGLAAGPAGAQPRIDLGSEAQRETGKVLYAKYCSQCHGDEGDGEGVAAPFLNPKPRDFTPGKYKIRTTPTGALPLDEDVKGVIRDGIPYTAMPGFPLFSETDLTNLLYYLKSFSDSFGDPEAYLPPFDMPSPPPYTEASVARGREIYEQTGCGRCHGDVGRGDGLSAPTLVDDWGDSIRAADLSKPWTFRGGMGRRDVFRAMSSGFNGTPMPGFSESLPVEDRWAITDYIISLGGNVQEEPYSNLLIAVGTTAALDLEAAEELDELFAAAPATVFPVIGQIVEPGRNFTPSAHDVTVQAVFNRDEIAFRVSWNDMAAETSGSNGPDLEAPLWEAEEPAADAEDEGGFWGDEAVEDEAEDEGDFWGDEAVEEDSGDAGDFWGDEAVTDDEGGDDFWGEDDGGGSGSGTGTGFSDAVAIQLPMKQPEGVRKPYFLLGDLQNSVELWFADLAGDEVRLFEGRGSASLTELDSRPPEMTASYEDGRWSVTFKRKRKVTKGMPFEEGGFVPVAFSVWDGFNEERGNKRGLTAWYNVYVQPMERPSPFGPMAKAGFGVLGLELLIIGLVRYNRKRSAA